MSLPTLNTAYPSIDPWFDLRAYLVNGWRAQGASSCGVMPLSNLLVWNLTLIGDDATSGYVLDGIPGAVEDVAQGLPVLRPPNNRRLLLQNSQGTAELVLQRSTGTLYAGTSTFNRLGGFAGVWTITGTLPRGTEVA